MSGPKPHDELRAAAALPLSLLQTLRAVAWSFFGVRCGAEHAKDIAKLIPLHLIVAVLVGGSHFVHALVLQGRWVVSSGVATT